MPHWRERKFGHHVVISSLDGENGMAGFGSYSSSKAALNSKTNHSNILVASLTF